MTEDLSLPIDEIVAREEQMCRTSRVWLLERHAVIKNKQGELQLMAPLTLAQRKTDAVISMLRQEKKPVRIIIGKSRKRGLSTYIESDMFAETIYRGIDSLVIAHVKELSEKVFHMTRRFYDWWDRPFRSDIAPIWKPALYKGQTNKGEMRFENHEGHIFISTARDVYAGTGLTPQYIHATEGSKWEKGADVAISLFQSIARKPGTTLIHESTFNGYDSLFLPLWEAAYNNSKLTFEFSADGSIIPHFTVTNHNDWNGYIPIFISVLEDEDCWERFSSREERLAFIDSLDPYEQNLAKNMGARPEFLRGLRLLLKNECRDSLDVRKQEYPCTPEEAVIASGRARFDHKFLDAQPMEEGENGELYYSNRWDRQIQWRADTMSPLVRYREPKPNHRYVMGVDVAEGKLDENGKEADATVVTIHDIDKNMEQVAVLYGQDISEDTVVPYLVLLGEYYNGAFQVIESNSMGKHTCIEMGKKYPPERLFHRGDDVDDYRRDTEIGFRTTFSNKPILIGGLAEACSSNQITLHCVQTVREMRRYRKLAKGGTGPESGYHDDHVMALGLAVHGAKSYPQRLVPSTHPQLNPLFRRYTKSEIDRTRSSVTGY